MNILVKSTTIEDHTLQALRSLVLAFFPGSKLFINIADAKQSIDAMIEILWQNSDEIDVRWQRLGSDDPQALLPETKINLSSTEASAVLSLPDIGRENPQKLLLKRVLLKLLTEVTGVIMPWGILTGIRPTKLIHRMEDLRLEADEQAEILTTRYAVRSDKIQLLQRINQAQRPYIKWMTNHPRSIALYLGIPFCPSRCTYCSFPGFAVTKARDDIRAYLEALTEEVRSVGAMLSDFGIKVNALYFGGGTPTVLEPDELEHLIEQVMTYVPRVQQLEFTVEAGRPDSITLAKLNVLREAGVNRISVNPQTMHNQTLKRIGRAHQVEDVVNTYHMCRSLSDWVINMDLILGLPDERLSHVKETLRLVRGLDPDNLTVHVLALKRGSKEKEQGYSHSSAEEIEAMVQLTYDSAVAWGLEPYYLYRQKQMAGNLENIGYAKPGQACVYNIGIMEERQTILGVGAGASSKIVSPADYSLTNMQHSPNWQVYRSRWRELDCRRVEALAKIYEIMP